MWGCGDYLAGSPVRNFDTFTSFGSHFHEDERGSVARRHNLFGTRTLETDLERTWGERERMREEPYVMSEADRALVLAALAEVCRFRGSGLVAAHVRTNHVHVVVEAEARPERVMGDLKVYASRALRRASGVVRERVWGRHGSTRWLWTDADVRGAVRYVVEEQGEAMAVFVGEVP